MDGDSAAEMLRRRHYELAVRATLRQVRAARAHPAHLLSFVMREEVSRQRIVATPHQMVIFDFTLAHRRCVVRLPPGFAKTYSAIATGLWLLGHDPTTRGTVISSASPQAEKVVRPIQQYIEQSPELRLVFPHLRPTQRDSEPWTQSAFTVDRPYGIRDPSLSAAGFEGAIAGSRLNFILVDDLLDHENTMTEAQRKKGVSWFDSTVQYRLDTGDRARVIVNNTPWHQEDLTFVLQERGWPVLQMDAEGNIQFFNTDWDSGHIRPSDVDPKGLDHRLTEHDSPVYALASGHEQRVEGGAWRDVHDQVPLWPEKFSHPELREIRKHSTAFDYARKFLMRVRGEGEARFQYEWVEKAKLAARAQDIWGPVMEWKERFPTFTGVDLATSRKKKSDRSAVFTFALLPAGIRRPLAVDVGRWSGKATIAKVRDHHARFGSVVAVETNAAQEYLKQWMLDTDRGIPVRSHQTGMNKWNPRFGVESIFIEFENGAWLVPNDPRGVVPDGFKDWLDDMASYDPEAHTGDVLMACWIARELARRMGYLGRDLGLGDGSSVAAGATAR